MRLIAKWISQGLMVIAACVTGDWSLVDAFHLMHDDGSFHLFGMTLQGPKSHIELGLRLFISVCAVALIAATDLWDVYLPRRKLDDFRTEYLKLRSEDWKKELADAEIRLSIWYAKRPWYWPFWKVFYLAWSDGFDPPRADRDKKMRLASWQGISGQAYRSRETVSLSPLKYESFGWFAKWLMLNSFRMTASQLARTRDIKALLSTPMLLKNDPTKTSKAAGVINLDSLTDKGAKHLMANVDSLSKFFSEQGKVLAHLAT
jgi:hypothetical protein